jgi:uncharacterized protein YdeI (YjbR/CyaY-like superfamily)
MPAKPKSKHVVQSPYFFTDAHAFRDWLEQHHASETELLVGYYKVGSGRASMSWPESVDEALCFGWIDGVRKRIDGEAYQIRFSPRRSTSIWSAVNIAKIELLIAQDRVRPAGLKAYSQRSAKRSRVYSFEQAKPNSLGDAEIREFQRFPRAWQYFESVAPSYRKAVTHWILAAKQDATRTRRLAQLIEACAECRRLLR